MLLSCCCSQKLPKSLTYKKWYFSLCIVYSFEKQQNLTKAANLATCIAYASSLKTKRYTTSNTVEINYEIKQIEYDDDLQLFSPPYFI